MKFNGYEIINTLLEMETGKLLNRGRKILMRGVKNDKLAIPMGIVSAAVPGGLPASIAIHAARNKRSRDVARTMARRLLTPSKW